MPKGPSYEHAVIARIAGAPAYGPWLTQGRLARVIDGRLEATVQAPQHSAFQAAFSGSAPASECRGAYSTYVTRPSADVSPDQSRLESRPLRTPERLRLEVLALPSGETVSSFAHASPWIDVATRAPRVVRHDGERLVVCDLEGACVAVIDGDRDTRPLAIAPDGSHVAGTSRDGHVLWDARTGARVGTTGGRYAGAARFSPDGAVVALDGGRTGLELAEVEGWRSTALDAPGSKGAMVCPAFSPSGARVAFSLGRGVSVIDVATRALVATIKSTKGLFGIAWIDEDTIAMAARASLVLHRVPDGAERAVLDVRCTELAVDHEAGRLACATGEIWKLAQHAPETTVLDVPALLALEGAAPAKKTAKPRTKKAALRGCFFGVPSSLPLERVVAAARNLHYILDRQPGDFALLTSHDEASGLRWLTFVGSKGRRYLLDPWIETLALDLGELTVALADGARTRFERYEGVNATCVLVGDGRSVHANDGTPHAGGSAIAAGLGGDPEPALRALLERGEAIVLRERRAAVERTASPADVAHLANMVDLDHAYRR